MSCNIEHRLICATFWGVSWRDAPGGWHLCHHCEFRLERLHHRHRDTHRWHHGCPHRLIRRGLTSVLTTGKWFCTWYTKPAPLPTTRRSRLAKLVEDHWPCTLTLKEKTPWISCSRTPEKSRCSGSIHCQAAACTTTDAFTRRRRRRCSIWSSSWVVGSSVDDQLYCEEGNWVGVLGAANVFWALLIPILYNYSWWCFAYSLLVWCACRHPHLPPILTSVSRVGSTVSPKSWSPQSMVVISCYVNGKACEN